MKILTALIKTLLSIFFILFLTGIAIFFLTIFMPEQVLNAIEIFKNIFSKRLTTANLGCII